jgi:drug/metabolite transporter (DMT)-like permease
VDWVALSLANAAILAGVSVLDKRILSLPAVGLLPFSIVVGVLNILVAGAAALAVSWETPIPRSALLAAMASGLFWGVGLVLLFYGIQLLEVSRVMLVFHTFPVFVAIMAVLLLDETLRGVHWLGILLTVIGAGLVTADQKHGGKTEKRRLALALVLLASVLVAAANVATKHALQSAGVGNVFALRTVCMGLVLLLPLLRPHAVHGTGELLRHRQGLNLTVLTEGILAPVATLVGVVALGLGSVSLVSTLMATRPLLVLVLSSALSTRTFHLLDEPLRRDTLALKALSTALVVGGVTILTLA